MGEGKHTPGPWYRKWANCITQTPDSNGSDSICHVYDRSVPGEYQANMALIAAAPDLLEALSALLLGSERHIFGDECLRERDAARAAILKATNPLRS